ncbi:hypothetical protein B0J13DRAFT_75656 [Dactylonectria estremocensis]|uniref:Uncharacterized protein n=1 Tax=Dactylonectria estremocensis TaxID=1079267 RepID=A0A9P9EHJ3_9HYPO|nr:hypothetical protein B0J13DRAFT_75656 [Dactylonectria estremocensis]
MRLLSFISFPVIARELSGYWISTFDPSRPGQSHTWVSFPLRTIHYTWSSKVETGTIMIRQKLSRSLRIELPIAATNHTWQSVPRMRPKERRAIVTQPSRPSCAGLPPVTSLPSALPAACGNRHGEPTTPSSHA